jgi:PilZ domain
MQICRMDERRRVRRTRVYKGAKISMNASLADCIVRDMSSLGARLATMTACSIPDRFSLTFDTAGTTRACRVAWRSSTELGVEFCAFHPA